MVVMQGNGGAGKITIGVCVMEKKVRIFGLWFTEFANTWVLCGS
jgi:hypothetical protein